MSKDIWHTADKTPEEDRLIVVENHSGLISVGSEFEYDLDRVRKWAYLDDLLDCEQELIRTRKALGVAVDALNKYEWDGSFDHNGEFNLDMKEMTLAHKALEQITALEQKDVK